MEPAAPSSVDISNITNAQTEIKLNTIKTPDGNDSYLLYFVFQYYVIDCGLPIRLATADFNICKYDFMTILDSKTGQVMVT